VEITLVSGSPENLRANVVVIGAFADGTLSPPAQAIDRASQGNVSAVIAPGHLDRKAGASLLLPGIPGIAAERVLLVSLGQRDAWGDNAFRQAIGSAARVLAGATREAAVTIADVDLPGRSLAWRLREASRLLADGAYRFDAPRAKNDKQETERGAGKIALVIAAPVNAELETAVRRGQGIAEGMALAKDLGNLPANVCTPTYLADTAQALGKEFNFKVEVLERADMEKLGMGSALSVGRGSHQPCKFIVMHYTGGPAAARPIVLIGKGMTFDTGGISLKPADDLDMMKYDMSGGGSVFGAFKTIARLALPFNVVGIVTAHENMPGGNASRPGDVVKSMSGQTIEILNTDAEGRLALCDALTYAERFLPACVIDIATLTGACVIALGAFTSGLFANDDELASELLESGADAGDRAWRLPLGDEYQEMLRSNFADMANIGGRPAGAITAACFLARFAKAFKWAHLDIAGTASVSGKAKGSTGRPVPLLCEFLLRRADAQARSGR
jgi:leucyl aminopeptidase